MTPTQRKTNKQKPTRKRGNCQCIATWGRLTLRQCFSALITTPCQVWSRWTYPLLYSSVFTDDTLVYTFDLWFWTFVVYRLWRDETLYQTWTQSSNPRRSYCDFNIWPYNQACTCVTCWYVMSRCDLDFWSLDLELLQHFGCHSFKLRTEFERSNNPGLSYWRFSTVSPCNLGLEHFCRTVLRGAWTQLHQTWQKHKAIICTGWAKKPEHF